MVSGSHGIVLLNLPCLFVFVALASAGRADLITFSTSADSLETETATDSNIVQETPLPNETPFNGLHSTVEHLADSYEVFKLKSLAPDPVWIEFLIPEIGVRPRYLNSSMFPPLAKSSAELPPDYDDEDSDHDFDESTELIPPIEDEPPDEASTTEQISTNEIDINLPPLEEELEMDSNNHTSITDKHKNKIIVIVGSQDFIQVADLAPTARKLRQGKASAALLEDEELARSPDGFAVETSRWRAERRRDAQTRRGVNAFAARGRNGANSFSQRMAAKMVRENTTRFIVKLHKTRPRNVRMLRAAISEADGVERVQHLPRVDMTLVDVSKSLTEKQTAKIADMLFALDNVLYVEPDTRVYAHPIPRLGRPLMAIPISTPTPTHPPSVKGDTEAETGDGDSTLPGEAEPSPLERDIESVTDVQLDDMLDDAQMREQLWHDWNLTNFERWLNSPERPTIFPRPFGGQLREKFITRLIERLKARLGRDRLFPTRNLSTVKSPFPTCSNLKLDDTDIAAYSNNALQTESEKLSSTPNDPLWPMQWYLPWSNALEAWQVHRGDEEGAYRPIVCVVDTGIDYTHPDLKANLWVNEAELNGRPGVDDDGNGYVDDIYGINALSETGDPMDDNSHGTHCAGVVGAVSDNKLGVAGVNRNALLMGCKFLGSDGGGAVSNAVKCIDYAISKGASVLSNSWGGGGSRSLKEAVMRSREHGVLFVAAAGNLYQNNDVIPTYPANYDMDNILSIASTDKKGLSPFSNYGVRTVHVAAPGTSILSTVRNQAYANLSGTSMACPAVAGLASLMKSASPLLTYSEIKEAIRLGSRPFSNLETMIKWGGVVDHKRSMELVVGPAWYRPVPSWPAYFKPQLLGPGEESVMPFAFLGLQAGRLVSNFTIVARSTETNATQRVVVPVSLTVKRFPRLNMTAIPTSLRLPFLRGQPSLPARVSLINRAGVGLVNVTVSVTSPSECAACLRTDLSLDERISIATQRTLSVQCLASPTPVVSRHEIHLLIEEGPPGAPPTERNFTVSCEPLGIAMLPSVIVSGTDDQQHLANISSLAGNRDGDGETRSEGDTADKETSGDKERRSIEKRDRNGHIGKLFLSVVQDPCTTCGGVALSSRRTGVSYLAHFVAAEAGGVIVGYKPRVWLSRRLKFVNVNNLAREACNLDGTCASEVCASGDLHQVRGLSQGRVERRHVKSEWTLTELFELRGADDAKQNYVFTNFRFPFFEETHSEMIVSSNGFVAFEDWQHDRDWAPALSSGETPNKVIAPLWGDMSVQGSVSVLESDHALIVQWHQLTNYAAPAYGTYTFQLILLRSGTIIFVYQSVPSIESLQIGLKGPGGEYKRRAPSSKIDEDLLENGNLVYSPIFYNKETPFRFLSTGDMYDFFDLHEGSSFDSVLNFSIKSNTTGHVSVLVGSDTFKDLKTFNIPVSP